MDASITWLVAQASSEGITTKDWVIPLITALVGFGGGLAGVVIGQRLSRETQLRLENRRDKRERELEQDKERREIAADERAAQREATAELSLARAIARVLQSEFQDRRSRVVVSAKRSMWWPGRQTITVDLPLEDRKVLAAHLKEQAWEVVVLTLQMLRTIEHRRAYDVLDEGDASQHSTDFDFSGTAEYIGYAISELTDERERLASIRPVGPE